MQDHDRIGIKDNMLKLWKISEIYKDFNETFYKIWANVFHNYVTIFITLFSKEALNLYASLADIYISIYKLSVVYKSQKAVFFMAIKAHIFIIAQQPIDPLKWVISNNFRLSIALVG